VKESGGGFSEFDIACMKRAFTLALRGAGRTSPNPMVGAVVARGGRIIGEGWHKRCGDLHAEARAIASVRAAGESPVGADLYCTLEPCCFISPEKHQPPCAGLIIQSGIRRVVVANIDPHPKVNGGGLRVLRKAGVVVESGLLSGQGEELNRDFFTWQRLGRPFVHVKIAQTLDGKIAALRGSDKQITDEAARKIVHRLRARYDAVLIGGGTAAADNPELTVRLCAGRNPFRVVLDSKIRLPLSAKLFRLSEKEKTLIVCSGGANGANPEKIRKLLDMGAVVIPLDGGDAEGLPLRAVLAALGGRGIRSVLVEGGEKIFSSFLREGLWDRLSVFLAPLILGGGKPAVSRLGRDSLSQALCFQNTSIKRIGNQILFEGENVYRNC
jgi:diaminohydroxyphosphoribosylaminopyrimidine deaminase/5-amino-6-(5-phosphoribosylamino)uracil reductase